MPDPRRLFHTIVVLGAALSGCGGKEENPAPEDRDAGRPPRFLDPDAASEVDAGGGTCTPVTVRDCVAPADFLCDQTCTNGQGATLLQCRCRPEAPDAPSECEKPEDYHCVRYTPEMTGCRCITGSPTSMADCTEGGVFICKNKEPPLGCECVTIILK